MIEFDSCYADLEATGLKFWREHLPKQVEAVFQQRKQGKLPEWKASLAELPEIIPSALDFNAPAITIGKESDCDAATRHHLENVLRRFHPWRKGPYDLFGIDIDTEWHSDWKWERLAPHISALDNRLVLDVGCGNGYHAWRMYGAGARLVVGADPSQFFLAQFHALKYYASDIPVHILPLKSEEMPDFKGQGFDTVFSMGVLYHRRSPLDHLMELKGCLREGGELVLETLIIEGNEHTVLMPEGRYGKMRNVWFLPSPALLERWLQRCGFKRIRVVDVTTTTIEEQRVTPWMQFESLSDFLDPEDSQKTIEGYPGPRRAIVLCER